MRYRYTGTWDSGGKILPRKELARLSRLLREEKRSLVLTNGCFDVLHLGHVRYLEQAKSLGDVLIVGINNDSSVRNLKGPQRPFNCEQDRAEIVAALACVDFVTIFSEETAGELVREVQPAFYVKGGDYSPDPDSDRFPVEGHVVRELGGKVTIVGLLSGHSTTRTLRRLGARLSNNAT